ncbi:PREDICTED: probable ADP-ribosylation factor GTPase-activating protein AGD14 isoform X4 [Lupinus angustifolius]|uniref:probable ADP-ribosylation factor GTPase-activating protein AGD14 isoform X3 n=1 Tax=Lupinus angustifolius TaxID=3871 RepID=UPI00092EFA42|nr:PREDICTED: probable ADP-ribosylation factor GTPase-activating protein AGD14 isoform X3 [Lupinus angustifolius]XP_019427803.1 PREDICTED: probable ADP-ribosylation factor GTPase-activating protein AGD14 isoform X4 [Lupinus angustifolius]
MGSRKEEEKREKIIRGLMKLPPNRRCINCNSMGPQYVCTSFWTFVCVTCSGIHREFTHRVKSVSMAKFTSQEVDALQNGGNQRARETYLNSWDFQRQRLPDNSNVAKIREFIRNVYVDRRYAGAKSSEKPPRDPQSPTVQEDDLRRASSYHSFSQSPPYDNQYEDRRYGKQASSLTRKPGSDKVRYEGKMSNIIYSPGRFSDHAFDDRFANEGSGPRISDFSVSSAGDQFKSDVQSPTFHKDVGLSSPSYQGSGSNSIEDVWSQARNTVLGTNAKRDAGGTHGPQRTTSLQSANSNFSSLRSYNSVGVVDFFSEPVQASGSLHNKAAGAPHSSGPTRSVSMNLSKLPLASELFPSSTPSIDLFQLPGAPPQAPLANLFQSSVLSAAPSFNESQPMRTPQPSSIDFFADLGQQPSTETSAATSHVPSVDLFQSSVLSAAPSFNQNHPGQILQPSSIDFFEDHSQPPFTTNPTAPNEAPSVNLFQSSVLSAVSSFTEDQSTQTSQTPPIDFFADVSQKPSTVTSDEQSLELSVPKNEGWAVFDMPQSTSSTAQVGTPAAAPSSEGSSQERFDPFSNFNANMQLPSVSSPPSSATSNLWLDGVWNVEEKVPDIATDTQPWNAFESSGNHLPVDADNQFLGSRASEFGVSKEGGIQGIASFVGFDNHDIPPHGDMQSNGIGSKSTNPFDYPYDSDVEHTNMFLDVSSLQASLPDALLPATFGGGIAEPWQHPQNMSTSCISSTDQGGLSFMSAQPLSSQIQNVKTPEPVASFGGNPFA